MQNLIYNMASPNARAIHSSRFVPRKPKVILIGKTSVPLYPKVHPTTIDPKKTLANQYNPTALAAADIDQQACILALAERLDLMLTAESGLADWERNLTKSWFDFQHLHIISWHNTCRVLLTTTTIATDPTDFLSRTVP